MELLLRIVLEIEHSYVVQCEIAARHLLEHSHTGQCEISPENLKEVEHSHAMQCGIATEQFWWVFFLEIELSHAVQCKIAIEYLLKIEYSYIYIYCTVSHCC